MPDDRKAVKNAVMGSLYGGSKTGRFGSHMHDYWEQAQAVSRRYRPDPPQYDGRAYLCTRCKKPMVSKAVAISDDKRCVCHHALRNRETPQAAMERRAHWLLKREFDEPDPVVIRDWKTSERIVMLPPAPAHPYKVDYAELEKRWMDLNDKMTNELIYGGVVTNNKEKP